MCGFPKITRTNSIQRSEVPATINKFNIYTNQDVDTLCGCFWDHTLAKCKDSTYIAHQAGGGRHSVSNLEDTWCAHPIVLLMLSSYLDITWPARCKSYRVSLRWSLYVDNIKEQLLLLSLRAIDNWMLGHCFRGLDWFF